MNQRLEIKPDSELLDLMLHDYAEEEPRWQATSYWREFAGPLVEYFRRPENVKHFRSAPIRTGIRSVNPSNIGQRPHLMGHGPRLLAVLNHVPVVKGLIRYFEETQDMLIKSHEKTFRHAQVLSWLYLTEQGKGQAVLDDMRVGDPDDGVEIEGSYYSYRSLGYQQLYLQAARYIDMRRIRSVVELGSGYGGQIEVFLRRNADAFCIAVDILPWLYIAEIYLKAVFPGQVMGYRETRQISAKIDLSRESGRYRVAMIPSWKWKYLEGPFDLFWNSKSLQEMNEYAACYLEEAIRVCHFLFLHAYTPRPILGVHRPEDLRNWVMDSGLCKECFFSKNLFAGSEGFDMLFEKTAK